MFIYEVNLTVPTSIAPDYSVWLREHVRTILDLDGFEAAAWYVRHADAPAEAPVGAGDLPDGDAPEGPRFWTVHYQVRDRAALTAYFEAHAAAMRQDGADRFGDEVTLTRRILEHRRAFTGVPTDDGGPM
jgi:hypothetical protein